MCATNGKRIKIEIKPFFGMLDSEEGVWFRERIINK